MVKEILSADNSSYVAKFLNSLWLESLQGNTRVVFLNATNPEACADATAVVFQGDRGQNSAKLRRLSFAGRYFSGPYFPFLNLIKDFMQGKEPEEIGHCLKKAGVYQFHRQLFASYLSGGEVWRYEEIIPEELEYEKSKMLESVSKLFFYCLGDQPMILVAENFQEAEESTLQLIRYLLRSEQKRKLLMVFTLNHGLYQRSEDISGEESWESFYEEMKAEGLVLDLYSPLWPEVIPPQATGKEFAGTLEEKVAFCQLYFHFLALKECQRHALALYEQELPGLIQPQGIHFKLLHLLGDVHTYLQENDAALLYYNTLLSWVQPRNDRREMANVFRKIGFVYYKKESMENAEKFNSKSFKLATELQDRVLIFKAFFLWYLIEDKRRIKDGTSQWSDRYDELIQMAKELGMFNSLMCCYANPYSRYCNFSAVEESYQQEAIRLARRYKNEYRLATVYQLIGLVHAVKGNYRAVLEYYKKSLRIKAKMGNKLELSYAYNALGYYSFMVGDYKQAFKYYDQALLCLKTVRDYHEIGMTLFNMANTAFLAFQHQLAIKYLEEITFLLNALKMKNGLTYHSMFGIYSLIAVNYYKEGNIAKAYDYIGRIKTQKLIPHKNKNEEHFLYELALGLLAKEEKDFARAEQYFANAQKYLESKKNDCIKFFGPRFYFECGSMLQERSLPEKAEAMFRTGLARSKELGYDFYLRIFTALLAQGELDRQQLKLRRQPFDHQWIIEAAKMEINMELLHKCINEINFLNNIQNILSRDEDAKSIITNLMNLINNNFLVETGLVHLREQDGWVCAYSNLPLTEADPLFSELIERLLTEQTEEFVPNAEEHPVWCRFAPVASSFISLPLFNGEQVMGNLFCGFGRGDYHFQYGDLKILSIASKQLAVALEKIKRGNQLVEKNQELQVAASTDALTGLANRHALFDRLEKEVRLAKATGQRLALLLLDLDNLKFYNDTFGHRIGDLVLRGFANILREATRGTDFIARFGGDEFIILLPESSTKEAMGIALRIRSGLVRCLQFQPEIERVLGYKVLIPEETKLSCSIGISEYQADRAADMEDLLQQGDKALYLAKYSGKNQVRTWQEVLQSSGAKARFNEGN